MADAARRPMPPRAEARPLDAASRPPAPPWRRAGRNALAWLGAALTLALGWSASAHRNHR